MKLSSIFMITQGVSAQVMSPHAGYTELSDVVDVAYNMVTVFLDGRLAVRQKWFDRVDNKVSQQWKNTLARCGDPNAPPLPAFPTPAFTDKCNDPQLVFDRIAAWANNYLGNCRSGAANRITERMGQWKKWMFLRMGCGYKWKTTYDRSNNGHYMAAGTYIIDNRCNPNWVSKNGANCQEYGDKDFCFNPKYTTGYWFSPKGQHIQPLIGLETDMGIQTAYSCPQCGCTGIMNTDPNTKPVDATYSNI